MPVKEFREFFLRNIPVTSGLKPDKQSNYPTTYTISTPSGGTVNVYNRFKKGNYPTEEVFAKLFESIAFKLNSEDTRTNVQQGLSMLASGRDIPNRTAIKNNFALGVSPANLPEVIPGNNVTVDIEYYNITTGATETNPASIPSNNTDQWNTRYKVNAAAGGSSTPVPEYDTKHIDSIANIKTGNSGIPAFSILGSTVFNPLSVLIPKDTLKTNGDYIEFELYYDASAGGSAINPICPYFFYLTFGNSSNGLTNNLIKYFNTFDYQDQNLHENANIKGIKINCKLYKKGATFMLSYTYELACAGYSPTVGISNFCTLQMENQTSPLNNFGTDNYLSFNFEPVSGAANGSHSAPVVIVKTYTKWV